MFGPGPTTTGPGPYTGMKLTMWTVLWFVASCAEGPSWAGVTLAAVRGGGVRPSHTRYGGRGLAWTGVTGGTGVTGQTAILWCRG